MGISRDQNILMYHKFINSKLLFTPTFLQNLQQH